MKFFEKDGGLNRDNKVRLNKGLELNQHNNIPMLSPMFPSCIRSSSKLKAPKHYLQLRAILNGSLRVFPRELARLQMCLESGECLECLKRAKYFGKLEF